MAWEECLLHQGELLRAQRVVDFNELRELGVREGEQKTDTVDVSDSLCNREMLAKCSDSGEGGERNVIMSFPPCFLDLRAARKYDAAVFIHGQASLCTQTWTKGAQKGFKRQKGISLHLLRDLL